MQSRLCFLALAATAAMLPAAAKADVSYSATTATTLTNADGGEAIFSSVSSFDSPLGVVDIQSIKLLIGGGGNPEPLAGTVAFAVTISPYPAGVPATTYDISGAFSVTYSGGPVVSYTPSATLVGTTDLYTLTNISIQNGSGLGYSYNIQATISAVPEPSSLALCGAGLAGLFGVMRRRRR